MTVKSLCQHGIWGGLRLPQNPQEDGILHSKLVQQFAHNNSSKLFNHHNNEYQHLASQRLQNYEA